MREVVREPSPNLHRVSLEMQIGRFLVKSIFSAADLSKAFRLRHQVFQVEMIGRPNSDSEDRDEFDLQADHLAVIDSKTQKMVATCRLNSSLFVEKFYSETEFSCGTLISRPEIKVELGRVCVDPEFRRGVVILLIWRALAEYMKQSKAQILFGCGSVSTVDPQLASLIYRYLLSKGTVRRDPKIDPLQKYRSVEFDKLLEQPMTPLTVEEIQTAEKILPPLCKSYFEMGCYVPGPPAFDRDFKCIDFLTILDMDRLDPLLRKKMMGNS